jgi:hypothetical protein
LRRGRKRFLCQLPLWFYIYNGVSELSLAPHRATMLTTKHSPAEIARKKSRAGAG